MSFLTVRKLAEYLGTNQSTIYRYMRTAHLPSFRIGGRRLFKLAEVDAWIESQRAKAA